MNEPSSTFDSPTFSPNSPDIQYMGRTIKERRGVRFAWTGTEIRIRFEGPKFQMALQSLPGSPEAVANGYHDHYDIWI
ncbi:MAG: hypothetical protein AAF135_24175, partial [Bacteroidota bacterium]